MLIYSKLTLSIVNVKLSTHPLRRGRLVIFINGDMIVSEIIYLTNLTRTNSNSLKVDFKPNSTLRNRFVK